MLEAREEGAGNPPDTIQSILLHAARKLGEAGIAEPRTEARHVLKAAGFPAEEIIVRPDRLLTLNERRRVLDIAHRRAAREPLSRIMGERKFFGRDFHITPATLDPRADTETLVLAALETVRSEGWDEQPIRILDVGTGSGCLLVTLLAELPHATGVGTDVSAEALAVALGNARRHGVAARARFALRRSLSGVEGGFHMLVANPPYIARDEIASLAPEVRDHDPLAALDGGQDGLDIYREIARDLRRAVSDGWALFEVGAGQAKAVEAILRLGDEAGAGWIAGAWPDAGGHIRCVGIRVRCVWASSYAPPGP